MHFRLESSSTPLFRPDYFLEFSLQIRTLFPHLSSSTRATYTSSTDRMPTTLIILPADILALVVSYIRASSDLRNVSLTCKALYATAVVPIYRTMTLRLSSVDNRKLLQTLVPENAALLHVRHLVIDRFSYCSNENTENLLMTLQLLSNFLPRDTLISLT